MNSFYPNSYYKNPKQYKCCMIAKWKHRGVIYHNLDELYDVYINTLTCSHCNKEFKTSQERKLDHCHESGKFRAIVCNSCNIKDSYIKYPPHFSTKDKEKQNKKEYRELNREQLNEKHKEYREKNRDKINQKGNCFFCNKHMMLRGLKKHYDLGRCIIKPIT